MLLKIRFLLALLSWHPFETDTEEGRSKERYRRILWTTLASAFAKFTGVLTSIVTIPLTFNYLDAERFGLWMLFNTLVAFFTFADFGVGYGLLNSIANAKGKDDKNAIQTYIASGITILWVIAFLLILIFLALYPFIKWEKVFNVSSQLAIEESYSATIVFAMCIFLAIPLNIIQKIQSALQRGFAANLWQGIASLASFIGILSSVYLKLNLMWLVFSLLGLPLLINLLNNLWFFYLSHNRLALNMQLSHWKIIKEILTKGSLFFVLYFCGAFAISMDNLLIAQWLGAAMVSHYAVTEKLFSFISLIILLFILPLWAAYTEAFSRGDQTWIRKTLKRSIVMSLGISSCLSLLLIIFGEQLIWLLMNKNVEIPLMLLIGFGVWKIVEAMGMTLSIFLNGANAIREQAIVSICWAFASVTIKIILINYIGIIGVIWGSFIAYTLFMLFPFIYFTKNILYHQTLKKS